MKRGRLHRSENSTNTWHRIETKIYEIYICLIKNISNKYLFNPTNSDSDLSRPPPSCGGKTLLTNICPQTIGILLHGKRGEDLSRNSMKILASYFLGVKNCPRTRRKYRHLPNPVLLTTPPPKAISLTSLVTV